MDASVSTSEPFMYTKDGHNILFTGFPGTEKVGFYG